MYVEVYLQFKYPFYLSITIYSSFAWEISLPINSTLQDYLKRKDLFRISVLRLVSLFGRCIFPSSPCLGGVSLSHVSSPTSSNDRPSLSIITLYRRRAVFSTFSRIRWYQFLWLEIFTLHEKFQKHVQCNGAHVIIHRVFPFKSALRESGCRIGYEPTKNESRSLLAVDIHGHQRGGFCIFPGAHVKVYNQIFFFCSFSSWPGNSRMKSAVRGHLSST